MNVTFVIADSRLPAQVLKSLNHFAEVIPLPLLPCTYPSIAGHPDIHFLKTDKHLVYNPSVPDDILDKISRSRFRLVKGHSPPSSHYPGSARYNALYVQNLLIHNLAISDPSIASLPEITSSIHVNQGYTRCSLVALDANRFLTSDSGIRRVLEQQGKKVLHASPDGIVLPGFAHGFLGGCAGILEDILFFTGSTKGYPWEKALRVFVEDSGIKILELSGGPLWDGGSLLFV